MAVGGAQAHAFPTPDPTSAQDVATKAYVDASVAYTNWTPAVSQSTVPGLTNVDSRYQQVGKHVSGRGVVTIASGTGTASNAIHMSIPVTAASSINGNAVVGVGWIKDVSAALVYYGLLVLADTGSVQFLYSQSNTQGFIGAFGMTAALALNDQVVIQFDYEAA